MHISKTKIQIRFADADPLNHVNNVNMQHYFDIGKSEFFAEILDIHGTFGKNSVVQANLNTNFYAPVFLTDDIIVTTELSHIGNRSFVLLQKIVCNKTGFVKADSKSTLVCFDAQSQTAVDMPDSWREKFNAAI